MNRFRLLLRHPSFVLSIWFWGGAALAVGIALAGLFRLRIGWPPGLEAVTKPVVTSEVAWRPGWSPAAVTPASAGARGVEGLLGGFSGLAALGMLMALVNVGALVVARRALERRDRAVRLSLGASARDLARYQARRGRFLNAGAALLGVAAGLLATLAMRLTWPDGLHQPGAPVVVPVNGRLVHMREPAVRTMDPASFLMICLVLAVVAVATALTDTHRVTRSESAYLLTAD